jgi:hypothetical protein
MPEYVLWDFLEGARFENVILRWVQDERLTKRDRAALNNRIRRLAQTDYALAVQTKLLAGPIYKHVYKLVIHADRMLRPMLCRGPIDNETEYTFLLGAIEINWKLPRGSKEQAEGNREVVLSNADRRCIHEDIPQ